MDTRLAKFKFQKAQRIRSSSDFDRVFKVRCAVHLTAMGLYVDRSDLGYARLGIRINKRLGNAARRVRVRRCLREAFRLMQNRIPPLDYVAVLRSTEPTTKEFEVMLLDLASRAEQKLNRQRRSRDGR